MNFARVRARMIQTQLVARGVTDTRVLETMAKIERHRFVEEALQDRAYDDKPLPIGEGQTISQPFMVGLMTQALELHGAERVLEIGTGSGYQTAILAELVDRVFSVERHAHLARTAQAVLEDLGYRNVALRVADGTLGWPAEAPFDAIVVAAAAPRVPRPLVAQLAEGGRIVFPIGEAELQTLVRIHKNEGRLREEYLGECRFVPLVGQYGWAD